LKTLPLDYNYFAFRKELHFSLIDGTFHPIYS
jgi:hypothetical protein